MSKLALLGGPKVRTSPFPAWPVVDDEDVKALADVCRGLKWGVGGPKVPEFADRFAAFQEAKFGVAMVNGTQAIQVALHAMEIGPGDEVIVPPYTFIATASAALMCGAVPVFVDIDPGTYLLDASKIEAAITPRTRAIVPVHIGGGPADMDAVLDVAKRKGLRVIEDAAQAHGAAWKGRRVGAIGDAGTFSFQSSKNLCAGEGGAVVTNDPAIGDRAWSLCNVGRHRQGAWYEHPVLGGNLRMTEFQAALLLSQMRRLPEQIALREKNAAHLSRLLTEAGGCLPLVRDPRVTTHAWHLFILRYDASQFQGVPREKFLKALSAEGIPCSAGYVPLYRNRVFQDDWLVRKVLARHGAPVDYSKVECPVCERVCRDESVWLTQSLLLGGPKDMEQIAEAVAKVRANASELL